jgi:hypothetical protein
VAQYVALGGCLLNRAFFEWGTATNNEVDYNTVQMDPFVRSDGWVGWDLTFADLSAALSAGPGMSSTSRAFGLTVYLSIGSTIFNLRNTDGARVSILDGDVASSPGTGAGISLGVGHGLNPVSCSRSSIQYAPRPPVLQDSCPAEQVGNPLPGEVSWFAPWGITTWAERVSGTGVASASLRRARIEYRVVPEPRTTLLLACGGVVLAAFARRRRLAGGDLSVLEPRAG